jgi:phage shock protein PspC (stress-responsive transcriptional regulator)
MTTDTSTTSSQFHSHASERTLQRSCSERMVAGVAGGLAEYLDADPMLVRLGFVALTLLGGAGIPLYLAAWLLVPEQCAGESVAEGFVHHRRAA